MVLPALVAAGLVVGCAPQAVPEQPLQRAALLERPGRSPAPPCSPAPLDQRAAAVLLVGLPGVTRPDDALARTVVDLGVGGVFLSESNVESADQVRALVGGLQAGSNRPLLVSADEESGRVAVSELLVDAGPSPRKLAERSTPAMLAMVTW